MSQSLAVPTTRLPSVATKARPSAGNRPSRSRCELLRQRWPPKASSSSASRAATSGGRSFLIEIIGFVLLPLARNDARSRGRYSGLEGPAQPAPAMSDVIGLQRREAVECYRGVGRRIGAGPLDQHFVADLETDREHVWLLLVQHVGGIAGRSREHARCQRVAIPRGADRV